jgi:excisionase family DNA binding protein
MAATAEDLGLGPVAALQEAVAALRGAAELLEQVAGSLTSPAGPLVYSVEEAARLLGISTSSAYELIARSEFPVSTRQLGRRRIVPRAALDRYLGEPASP